MAKHFRYVHRIVDLQNDLSLGKNYYALIGLWCTVGSSLKFFPSSWYALYCRSICISVSSVVTSTYAVPAFTIEPEERFFVSQSVIEAILQESFLGIGSVENLLKMTELETESNPVYAVLVERIECD